jgi:hypothetical protein
LTYTTLGPKNKVHGAGAGGDTVARGAGVARNLMEKLGVDDGDPVKESYLDLPNAG